MKPVQTFSFLLLEMFEKARKDFEDNIVHWGYQRTKQEFYEALERADVAVSTAVHEFFGVAMYVTYLLMI